MSLKLTLLGTGTPTPLVHRAGSGYLVTFDEETLLFDCGPGGILPRERPDPLVTEVANGSCIQGGNWRVETAEVVHVQPQLTCLAYRLDTPYGAIVFGGDTAPTRRLTDLARDADVLIHMCHFINDVELDPRITGCCSGHLDAARTASEADVGTLILTHVTEQPEPPGIRERLVAEAAPIFSGRIVFAEDLTEVPVGRIGPEPIQ